MQGYLSSNVMTLVVFALSKTLNLFIGYSSYTSAEKEAKISLSLAFLFSHHISDKFRGAIISLTFIPFIFSIIKKERGFVGIGP
jgi:hypothetical protein